MTIPPRKLKTYQLKYIYIVTCNLRKYKVGKLCDRTFCIHQAKTTVHVLVTCTSFYNSESKHNNEITYHM